MSQKLIRKTNIQIDLSRLQQDFWKFVDDIGFTESNQVGLTHRPGHANFPDEGVGSLVNKSVGSGKYAEEWDYTEFVNEMKHTYMYEIWKTMPFGIGRMRLVKLPPFKCMSFHSDTEKRWHIAIETNPNTFFFFEGMEAHQIPADGYVYKMDATVKHTVFNAHPEKTRYHLVMSDAPVRGHAPLV